ncbi:MAG: hypothetical protein K5930_10620 [Treponemataceae bacterium]|nr:hypothetical protein [Treponemataceae bacterium]
MENNLVYEIPRTISSAYIDSTVRLGVAQTWLLVQDNVTECLGRIECDGVVYKKRFNAFWVFTKIKIHFEKRPDWREIVSTRTFPVDNSGLRTHINTEAFDKDGSLAFAANYEACVLSFDNHRPLKLTTLGYPADNFPRPVFNAQFSRFPAFLGEDAFLFEQVVRFCHIDMSQHMNNAEYTKLALSVFTNEYLKEHDISDIEAHYTGECKEGQILRVYRYEADGNVYVYIKEGERTVYECSITFKN